MKRSTWQKLFKLTLTAVLILLLILGYNFVEHSRRGLYDEKLTYLKEISAKSALNVKNNVNTNLSIVESLATIIGAHPEVPLEQWLPILADESTNASFKRIGIIKKDGETIVTDGGTYDFSDRPYAKESFEGKASLSDALIDRLDGSTINVFSAPIFTNGEVAAVLFATRNQNQFAQSMQLTGFDGEGYFYLINGNGEPIVKTTHRNSVGDYTNLFTALKENGVRDDDLAEMHFDIDVGADGSFEYVRNNNGHTLYYTSVGVKDWYLVSVVATKVISRQSDILILELIILTFIIIISVLAVSFSVVAYTRSTNKKLAKIAYTDHITGYPNWESFKLTAYKLINAPYAPPYAIVIFDINNFKVINDIYGHSNGNKLLHHICEVMENSLDKSEAFCRVSADNFDMLLKYTNDAELIRRIENLELKIKNYIAGYNIVLSFGIYEIGDEKSDIHVLSDRANISKAIVKKQSAIHYHFFKDENRADILREKEIENIMQQSLDDGEFKVYLQPKYSLSTETVAGAEALVRWQRQTQIIMPNDFIPLFEKNGFIRNLDLYMFRSVCALLAKWQELNMPLVPISVNISRVHLSNESLPTELADIARSYGVPTNLLEIELTESAVFLDTEHMISIMRRIKELGFMISIDDFGSGYSTFAALKDLPADIVKIDKSFLDNAIDDNRGEQILKSIIDMTHGLCLVCVAEGMETKSQQVFLTKAGCDIAQGYYYSRPITIELFEQLVQNDSIL
ncbi:MAG: EAL domain-containing protein [Oscillospiraceae bacterium]